MEDAIISIVVAFSFFGTLHFLTEYERKYQLGTFGKIIATILLILSLLVGFIIGVYITVQRRKW